MAAQELAGFGTLLRRHRLAAGLTQELLAARAGLSLRAVSDLERGARRAPYPDTVRRLADALALPASERSALSSAGQRVGHLAQPRLAPPSLPAALPVSLTSFVGRERDLDEVRRLLGVTRLLTLTGPGGVGKTRLALEAARQLAADYPDGIALVDLAALSTPDLVPERVAAALGVREPGRGLLGETLLDVLRSRHALLLFDNCEHLVEACAALAATLLPRCPEVRMLATSREPLGVAGEVTWSVPPLDLPAAEIPPSIEHLLAHAAVRLFVDRARAVRPDFLQRPTEEDAQDLVDVCRRLEGVPLAIELAAAWVPVLSVAQIAGRLDDPLGLLVRGSRTAPPRQRTLRATLEWSYDRLDEPERRVFERLSVFAGGWTLEAAEDVCAGEGIEPAAVMHVLGDLVRRSLVLAEPADRALRYRLLETLRQFAGERLSQRPEADAVRDRHAACFLALAERAAPALVGPDEGHWLGRLEREHDNLRAALRRLIERRAVTDAQRLAGALYRFWYARGHFTEGRAVLAQVLQLPEPAGPTPGRAACWFGMDLLALAQGERAAAEAAAHAARSDWQAVGRRGEESLALRQLGILALLRGEPDVARTWFEAGLDAARAAGHRVGEGLNLWGLAQVSAHQEAFAAARRSAEAARACFANAGWRRGLVNLLGFLGDLRYWQGDFVAARPLLEQSLALARELGADSLSCSTLVRLGQVAVEMGDRRRASALLLASLQASARLGDREGLAGGLAACVELAAAGGDSHRALRLASATDRLHGGPASGGPASVVRGQAGARAAFARRLAAIRGTLEDDAAARVWAEGQVLTWDAALEVALSVCRSAAALRPSPAAQTEEQAFALQTQSDEIRMGQAVDAVDRHGLLNQS